MGDLSAFLAENAEKVEIKEVVISERFKGETGEPVPWKIKPLSAEEDKTIKKSCTYRKQIPGKRGQYTEQLDTDEYVTKLTAACVVFPNLNDAGLQASYKVNGAENLLSTMLLSGEMVRLMEAVEEICGLNEDFEDKVEEVKNA